VRRTAGPNQEAKAMQKLFALCLALTFVSAFAVGCDKKAEKTTETTVTDPSGTTTTTDSHTVETDKQ
jgi:hypothetical protein